MRFVLRMASRETRASWARLLFFFICIAIGVGAIVALRSVIQSVRLVLTREARTLLASDVLVSTNRPWSPEARRILGVRLSAPSVLTRIESIETATMARPADQTKTVARMVELRGVEAGFPLYGAIALQAGARYSHALLRDGGALVRPELLTQLDLRVGDGLLLGQRTFTIRGVITGEPGRRLGTFSFGPRVLIDLADLPSTGLLTFGSRAQYQILLRVREDAIQPLIRQLAEDFKGQFVTARSYRATEEAVGEDLARSENYLSLVGLVITVLGGIGVSSVTRIFVQQKIKSIAVLKCLGARTSQVLGIYLVQVLLLGLAGSLLGVALAEAAVAGIPARFGAAASSLSIPYGLTAGAVWQGIGIGGLVSLLFSLVPLLAVRHVKPSLLLRHDMPPPPRRDWLRFAATAGVVVALVALASWQAASLRVGLGVSLGFAAVAGVLHLAGRALVRLTKPLARVRWFPVRQASLRLTRPGNQTRVILLAVGLGSFFIIGVYALQRRLLDEFAVEVRENGPDMFLIDIQADQAEALQGFLVSHGTAPRLIPVLRARVTGVRGRSTTLDGFEDVRGRGSLAREYVITYRDRLEPNETVVTGTFQTDAAKREPEVSIEESIQERFGIGVGDTMRFDVLGRIINAHVTSVREVDWRDSRNGGFMFVFSPGAFDGAPHTMIALLKGPSDVTARARLQHDLVTGFPNVSVIDVREVLETIRGVLANVTLALSVVGGLVLVSGGLILIGAVAMTKFQRVYEAAIFKTLGASTRTIAAMLVFEYGMLGTLAGAIGSLGAIALTWGLSRYALDIPWRPAPAEHLAGLVLTALLVASVGVGSSLDILRRKPLATLRAE